MFEKLIDYPEDAVNASILDINKSFDKEITISINRYKNEVGLKLNSIQRKKLRDYVYYSLLFNAKNFDCMVEYKDIFLFEKICLEFMSQNIVEERLKEAREFLVHRMKNSGMENENIISSLITRIENVNTSGDQINEQYRDYISKYERNLKQLYIYNIKSSNNATTDLKNTSIFLNEIYDKLLNYHFAAIVFEDTEEFNFSWETIAKTAIYAENFKSSTDFPPFKKRAEKQKETLKNFILNNDNLDFKTSSFNINKAEDIVNEFYSEQSYGFIFTDLFISEDMQQKTLILQKIEYDSTNILCPDCLDDKPRGNSYTEVMFKSFECSNPTCKSRSKSGRGKRYNYLSAKLQNKKHFLTEDDVISQDIYKNFRKDIHKKRENIIKDIISLYSFPIDNVGIYTDKKIDNNLCNRRITTYDKFITTDVASISSLAIYRLLKEVKNFIRTTKEKIYLEENEDVIIKNAESSDYLSKLQPGQYSYAITSPPYYNAREYSQWPNLICYFIDMMINSYNVINTISSEGTYLYNIGDIVDQDNIYIPSMMSKRRQLLGMYSVLLFELVGWHTSGNIIWDKGEVQSKRNSTSDIIPYYVKPVNCYEHIWIFTKNKKNNQYQKIESFSPVIKIGRGGNNSAKHTAPYPLELVDLLEVFIEKEGRVLDPFLGSGTTALWCLRNNKKCLGLEINMEYYEVSLDRLNEHYYEITLF